MRDVAHVIVEALEHEIETGIKAKEVGTYSATFGLAEKAQAMSAILGRAIDLAKERGVCAQDLCMYFAEACLNKCVLVAKDAWFEYGFHYAEIEFDGLRCEWGKL